MNPPGLETGPQADAYGKHPHDHGAVPCLDLGHCPTVAFARITVGGTPSWLPPATARSFYQLHMVIDLYSRKIVTREAHTVDVASDLTRKARLQEQHHHPQV